MRPTSRALLLLALWLLVAAVAAFVPLLLSLWAGFGALVALLLLVDGVLLLRTPAPTCERRCPQALSLGEWHTLTLRLSSRARRPLRVSVHDHAPELLEIEGLPRDLQLPARGWLEVDFRVRPLRRGPGSFGQADLLMDGPLGLLRRRLRVGQAQELKVYPDFKAVSKYALLALDNRLSQLGIHLRRRRGEGTEFYQLREYRQGDSLRQVDWKAVSRRHQLVSREYRDEQDQRVVFLLDCGRRMHSLDGDLSHFDHALNAMLLLSYVGLRQGDAVGLMTFSGAERWLPPVKGAGQMTTLLNRVYDLQTSAQPSDYPQAIQRLLVRQRRRSLVVILTNLRDDDAESLPRALAPLRSKHLVLVASLRETALRQAAVAPIKGLQDATRVGAVAGYLEARKKVYDTLRHGGILTLDCEPGELPVALVNKYLEIKRAGVL